MVCVLHAAEEAGAPLPAIVLKDHPAGSFRDVERDDLSFDASWRAAEQDGLRAETAARLRDAGLVFCFINGTHHVSLGLWRHPQPFDVILPDAPDLPLDAEAEVIPADAMREVLSTRLEGQLRTIAEIAEVAGGTVYQVEAAPPPTDRWMLESEAGRKTRAKRRKLPEWSEGELAGRYVRYKLWRLHSQLMREHADQVGIRFLAHPPGATDDEGFLLDELCRNAAHANTAYGALVLEQM